MSRFSALHIAKQTGAKHTGTVIFFHGSGGTGDSMKEWVNLMIKNFSFAHIKVIYPTAPLQPYTPSGGMKSNVWFDRSDISPAVPEKVVSIDSMAGAVKALIQEEKDAGIPSDRIIVGGFSMGGALAFHIGYRWDPSLAGVFAFSSFLNDASIVYSDLKQNSETKGPPLLQLHGDSDDLVSLQWGQATFQELKAMGVNAEFHVLSRLGHSINKRGMHIIKEWVEKIIPLNVN